ncbi:2-isopropylmalate synthase [Herbivorax sp. ANBcel31]|uniref:2-isopropylmalate synthase n=1 Tax=Herbivorax sp. ANBcel31 TaxID=3069754 RepID=UPI0027B46A3E|nr:2-isopropylmalate synthase [Herbivorax sp. ANBcel31]MDQ2085150.1 2-isopropylmalate synthase [Herbivorax sp. ANBcel31]
MTDRIKIFDTTLRDGEQTPGVNLNIHEKLEIAWQLEKLGVDVIEAGFAIASPGDFEAVKAISENVKNVSVASLCRAVEKDIDRAWEAVKGAKSPRIHTFIATSDIHMKYKLKMSEEKVLERAVEMVKYAKKYCNEIEFSAEDASRTRPEFLFKVLESVIDAGAVVVNIPDTVGYTTPAEYGVLIKSIKENVSNIDKADISVHCHNDLGLAVANSLAAVANGATQIECTINGLGERAGNAAVEEIIMGLETRKDFYNIGHNFDTTQIYRTSKLVSSLTGIKVQPNKAIVGSNAFAHESGIHQHGVLSEKTTYEIMTPESIGLSKNRMVLGKLSGRHAFEERLKELGYTTLTTEEIQKAFVMFKDLADKKKVVLDKDIEALVEEKVSEVVEIYELDSFQITSGNKSVSTATISLKKNEEILTEAATGDGPVNAAFNAMERVVGVIFTLEDYSLAAVTEGKDALGEVTVRVAKDDEIFIGRGVSVDVIEASVKAYLNAINRAISEGES